MVSSPWLLLLGPAQPYCIPSIGVQQGLGPAVPVLLSVPGEAPDELLWHGGAAVPVPRQNAVGPLAGGPHTTAADAAPALCCAGNCSGAGGPRHPAWGTEVHTSCISHQAQEDGAGLFSWGFLWQLLAWIVHGSCLFPGMEMLVLHRTLL